MSDEIHRALGRIESKLDSVSESLTAHTTRLNDHSQRIRAGEVWRSRANGGVAVVTAAAGVVATVAAFIKGLWPWE